MVGSLTTRSQTMKFLTNYCIQEIIVPRGKTDTFDYSSELNLIASTRIKSAKRYADIPPIDYCKDLLVWRPDTGEIVQEIKLCELPYAILFLPGRYLAVSWEDNCFSSCAFQGVLVYSIDSGEKIMEIVDDFDVCDCMTLALSPAKRLLLGNCFREFGLDLNTKTIVEKRDVYESHCSFILCLCCSKYDYTMYFTGLDRDNYSGEDGFHCVNLEFLSNDKTNSIVTYIQHCFIDGEKKQLGVVTGLAHDGENIIVATRNEIIVLESASEGSIGHVVVSSGIPTGNYHFAAGRQVVNHKNQLMVCDGSDIIKVYEYKRCFSLKAMCRHVINSVLKQSKEKVDKLPLPNAVIKDYLVFKA